MTTTTTSSHAPLQEPGGPARATGLRASLMGALDGTAFSIPVSLGAATLVFSHVGLDLLPAGLCALMLSLALLHLTGLASRRPVLVSARFFEATTLAAMMDQVITQLPAWGLNGGAGVRLAFLCLIGAGGGLFCGVLYLSRADRFTRFIPAPVFVGFSNSIALALLASQAEAILGLLATGTSTTAVVVIVLVVLATGVALRRVRPRWPSAASGLLVGLVLGLAWLAAGKPTPMLGTFGWTLTLPATLADFRALAGTGIHGWAVATAIATNAAILGTMMFINTTLTAQVMTRIDGRQGGRARDSLWTAFGMTLAGALGSVPLSGAMNASVVASRSAGLTRPLLLFSALFVVLVFVSGIVGLIPLAAVSGVLLYEACFLVDRPSLRLFADWVRHRAMSANSREDLALIAAVMASAVLLNMVAAVFVGLLMGLALFAARNARRPVRCVWSGLEVSSNCARSRADLRLLAEHGKRVRVFELEGDLFFGAADGLERSLRKDSEDIECVVIDWSAVRHIDTSMALSVAQFERWARARGLAPIHAGADALSGNVGAVLLQHLPHARFTTDLDRALELAENDLIQLHGAGASREVTAMIDSATLFAGLDEDERSRLEAVMQHKLYRAGDVIVTAGDPGDELMLVLHGSASIVVRSPEGKDVRLAGARRGAMLGDMAFLDHARRSATVIAEEDTTVAVLHRDAYDALCASQPRLMQRLLANIALSLAARLRHTNRLALARQSPR
ncbi:MAG: cyclic nucleotide-binding protein [Ramlibacter sp.]|nr:cyclic nucleotide-binding protein [Ramlibacter sp.]